MTTPAGIIGIPGRLGLESVATIDWNAWPHSSESAVSGYLAEIHGTGEGFINGTEQVVVKQPVGSSTEVDQLDLQTADIAGSTTYGLAATLMAKSTGQDAIWGYAGGAWDQYLNLGGKLVVEGDGSSFQSGLAAMAGGVRGYGPVPTSDQGGWELGWNNTGGNGETDFWNMKQGGSVGGFRWYDYENSTSNPIMSLTGAGALTTNSLGIAGGPFVVDSSGNLTATDYSFSNVGGGTSTINGTLNVGNLNVSGGEAHYAQGAAYTDPQGGVARSVKIAGSGLAMSGGEYVSGGIAADSIAVGSISSNSFNLPSYTPPTSSQACNIGYVSWDASYLYVCVATNTWRRTALATW